MLALVLLLSSAAFAQESGEGAEKTPEAKRERVFDKNFDKGFYVALRSGGVILNDADFDYMADDGEAKFDAGWLIGGAVGYAHTNGLRFELETLYRENDNDALELAGDEEDLEGKITALTVMFNLYYDADLSGPESKSVVATRLKPFVGAGFGLAIVDFDGSSATIGKVDAYDPVLAYQFMIGLNYWITPEVSADLRYALLGTQELLFEDEVKNDIEVKYLSQAIMVGLRYRF
jgi:opacity protein-like surface antigen